MKIKLSEPNGPYSATIDTEVMNVEIREAFLGVVLISPNGEQLAVCMRDGGFEAHYFGDFGNTGFDSGWISFNNGSVSTPEHRDQIAAKSLIYDHSTYTIHDHSTYTNQDRQHARNDVVDG